MFSIWYPQYHDLSEIDVTVARPCIGSAVGVTTLRYFIVLMTGMLFLLHYFIHSSIFSLLNRYKIT